jgi:hypothetical protein
LIWEIPSQVAAATDGGDQGLNLAQSVVVTIVGGLIVAAVVALIGLAWRYFSEHRERPLVQLHYWWEHVIDPDLISLSPLVLVGTAREIGIDGERYNAESYVRSRAAELTSDPPKVETWNTEESIIEEWVIRQVEPAFPVFDANAYLPILGGVRVLRVLILNTSRRSVLTRETFGSVRLTVLGVRPKQVHGWRHAIFHEWPLPPFGERGDSPTKVQLELTLPHNLAPRKHLVDDFTISYLREPPNVDPEIPKVKVEKTEQNLRLHVKPWEMSKTNPPRLWISRLGRRRHFHERHVELYVPTDQ